MAKRGVYTVEDKFYCCIVVFHFTFHDAEKTHKGLLTATVMGQADFVATLGVLKKSQARLTLHSAEPNIPSKIINYNILLPCQ